MAKRKTVNKGLAIFCSILFLIVGFGAGAFIQLFLFADSYQIPGTEQHVHTSAGEIDANVVKQEDLSIHFIELGNKYTGDCTLIKTGQTEILIDAGSRANSVSAIYDYASQFIEGKLDYVIVSHAHQDHYAGFATNNFEDSLFSLFDCDTVITFSKTNQKLTSKLFSNFNANLEQAEQQKGTKVYTVMECLDPAFTEAQETYTLENNVSLQFLYQKYYEEKAPSENDYSVCCMINQNNEKYYLFTGDLEKEGEESLVDEYKEKTGSDLPKMEVYKAGHHGSKTSSSSKLIDIIQPKIICVCCCAGSSEYTSKNENQFPTQEFINRIAPYTQEVYVTSLCTDYDKGKFESMNGDIVVCSSAGEQTSVMCSNSATVLKDTDWFKNNRTIPHAWKTAG